MRLEQMDGARWTGSTGCDPAGRDPTGWDQTGGIVLTERETYQADGIKLMESTGWHPIAGIKLTEPTG